MSSHKKNLPEFLEESFSRFREMRTDDVDSACYRVLQRLRTEPEDARKAGVMVPRPARHHGRLVVLIAAATLSVVFAQQLVRRPAPTAPAPPTPAPQIGVAQQQTRPVEPPKPEPPPVAAPKPLQFAAASIRIMPPKTPSRTGYGLACHGTDGAKRVVLTLAPGLDAVSAPQGRCVGIGIFLSTLVEMAFDVPMFQVSGGPEWSRIVGRTTSMSFAGRRGGLTTLGVLSGPDGFSWYEEESFRFEAVADDPATATLDQLRKMLQATLEDRFKLRYHIEEKEVPGYSLVLAEGGHKMKPISGEYVESLVIFDGRSTMEQLADSLRQPAGGPVIDKTGLSGAFEYKLVQSPPSGGGREGRGGPEPGGRGPGLSADLERELGLRLQAEKAIPIKALVIDSVEKPSPN